MFPCEYEFSTKICDSIKKYMLNKLICLFSIN